MEIIKHTSLGTLLIKRVAKSEARDMIITNHYSHKWNGSFGVFNYGIFMADNPEHCLGVAVYGHMKNPNAQIFTHPNPNAWMCELNRMWIDDCLGKNAETILIAASIRLLRYDAPHCVAIQSFADGRLGCGTIYKAANFGYFGFHYTTFSRNRRTGEVIHDQILTNRTGASGYIRANVAMLLGDLDFFRVKTYRYIYPLCKKYVYRGARKPYPAYERGEEPIQIKRDKAIILQHVITLLSVFCKERPKT